MNTDFEKQLERQTLRQPPAEWRAEIFAAAEANIPKASTVTAETELLVSIRRLLAHIPRAWAAVAALWLIIIGANSFLSGASSDSQPTAPMIATGSGPTIWNLQRTELSLLSEPFPKVSEPPSHPPKETSTPRSDRRREDGLGDLSIDCDTATIA